MKMRNATSTALALAVGLVAMAVITLLAGVFLTNAKDNGTTTTQFSSTSTAATGIQGVITGYVTVGPSQPLCTPDQSCNENMSGYSLLFTPRCPGSSSNCQASMAQLSPGGHYAILLPAGNYTVTGLYPSCNWMGCSSAFPKSVAVEGGMQVVFNVNIDTGIR